MNYLEQAVQILDDEVNWDPINSPLQVKMLLRMDKSQERLAIKRQIEDRKRVEPAEMEVSNEVHCSEVTK